MAIRVIDRRTPMPDIPLCEGLLPAYPAAFYDHFPHDSLMLWCHRHARYGLPTEEVVAWLKERIAGRKAIEIGSGCGDLAIHLEIPATDNRLQERAEVRFHYMLTGQPVIRYGSFVEKLDALEAVKKYQPEVVVANWVTHWIDPELPVPPGGGNMYGVKEDTIVKQCDYILIGNEAVHRWKPIMHLEHEEYALPFLRSRAQTPGLDRVWIWRKS